jgi:hypothetical protein
MIGWEDVFMSLFIPAALYALALVLTITGSAIVRHRGLLQLLGGFCWAAGTLTALLAGAEERWILLPTLLLLLMAGFGGRRERK